MTQCEVPPTGWRCTRAAGHDGPCAAVPDSHALPPEIAALIDAYRDALLRQEPPGRAMKGTRRIHLARETDSARSALETAITALVRDGERLDFLVAARCELGHRADGTVWLYPAMPDGTRPGIPGTLRDAIDEAAAALAASTPTPKV